MSYTYATLRTEIADWLENDSTEFSGKLDNIIMLGETRLMRDLNLLAFRKTSAAALVAGDPFVPKPLDFVTPRFFFIYGTNNDRLSLTLKDVSFVTEYWNDRATDTGTPKYYANWDHDTFIVCPTPDIAYTAELGYNVRPAGLSAGNTTTWLSVNAPDALLYVCLLEGAKFMKEAQVSPASIQLWQASYGEALDRLRGEEHFEVNTDDLRETTIGRQKSPVPVNK